MDLGLNGKVALVAASSGGLGLATAKVLLAEGARVFICGRNEERLQGTLTALRGEFGEEKVEGESADVANPTEATKLIALTVKRFGKLDILITNAGGPPAGSFDTTDFAAWEQGIAITLMSAVHLIHAALPHLRASDAASVLTVTSVSVKQPIPNLLLSNVLRPAVVGLTKSLAQELGPDGVRLNSILPGVTHTSRVDYLMENRAQAAGTSVEAQFEQQAAQIPLRRIGRPEEFGRVAAFLVSPAASYVTGESILVDGGMYRGLM